MIKNTIRKSTQCGKERNNKHNVIDGFCIICGKLFDERDGKTYSTVKIGEQLWMAENLAYRLKNREFYAFNHDEGNVTKYGYLYDWETAQNVAPKGRHL
jgi:hypothetical protein